MKRFLCAFIMGVAVFCGNCFAEDNWTINTIAYGVSGPPSVAVDINNTPIMACRNYPQDIVLITQRLNGYEVNSIPQTLGGKHPKLKVTSNNELALSFLKPGPKLWYGSKADWFDWVFSQVESSSVDIPDMDLTSNDIPHIVYSYQGWIYHTFYDIHSQQWVKEQLSSFGKYSNYNLGIGIAPNGKIMILCSDKLYVKAAVYSDGFWNYLPQIDGSACFSGSFTADSLPAVVFGRGYQLIYAVYINDIIGWVETVVASVSMPFYNDFFSMSLSHGSTGVPGIAYIDSGKLMYATNIAGGWTTTEIDTLSGTYSYPDLIFDKNDKPLISYAGYDGCSGAPVIKLAGIGLEPFNMADLNNDKIVNFKDFAVMADYWMAILPQPDLTIGDFDQNAKVDALDLRWLACNWLWGNNGQ